MDRLSPGRDQRTVLALFLVDVRGGISVIVSYRMGDERCGGKASVLIEAAQSLHGQWKVDAHMNSMPYLIAELVITARAMSRGLPDWCAVLCCHDRRAPARQQTELGEDGLEALQPVPQ